MGHNTVGSQGWIFFHYIISFLSVFIYIHCNGCIDWTFESVGTGLASQTKTFQDPQSHTPSWLDIRGYHSRHFPCPASYWEVARTPFVQQPTGSRSSQVGQAWPEHQRQHAASRAGLSVVRLVQIVGTQRCYNLQTMRMARVCKDGATQGSISTWPDPLQAGCHTNPLGGQRLVDMGKRPVAETACRWETSFSTSQLGRAECCKGQRHEQGQREGHSRHLATATAAFGPDHGAGTWSPHSGGFQRQCQRGPPGAAKSAVSASEDGHSSGRGTSNCCTGTGESGTARRQSPEQARCLAHRRTEESRATRQAESCVRTELDTLHEPTLRDGGKAAAGARGHSRQDGKLPRKLVGPTLWCYSAAQGHHPRCDSAQRTARRRHAGDPRGRIPRCQGVGAGGGPTSQGGGKACEVAASSRRCPRGYSGGDGAGEDPSTKAGAHRHRTFSCKGWASNRSSSRSLDRPAVRGQGCMSHTSWRTRWPVTWFKCALAFWQGQQGSLDVHCWPHGTEWQGWQHSVTFDHDFVSPCFAGLLGHSLARELEFASLGHQAVRCVDPRVGPITDAVINSVCQDPWTTSGAGTQSPPSRIFPPVSYDHMDSPVFDSQMADKGDEGDSGWAPQDAQGSTGAHLGCTYFCRTDLVPCTVCVPVPASAGLTEPGCSHLPGVNAGRCHPQLQPCLRSCLKSSAPCKPSLRVSPHVRFAFAISFWFPDQDQICLPIRHRDLASSCEQLPVCSPLPKPGALCPSAYFLCLDAPKDELSRPCATSCLPDVPAYLPCTPAKRVEHVGFRSPSVPLQQASAAGLLPPLRAERIEHVGFRSPRTTVGSDEFYTPGHVVCMPQQPASKAKVQGRSFQQMRPGAAPSRPSSAIFRSPLEGDCHHSPVPCVPVQGVLSDLSERFTSFDAIQQHSGLSKAADWSDDRCRQEAIARSPLPFPTGRISATNVEGFPVPQIIVSQIAMAHTHQTVVIAFSEATGFGGMHILVADVPSWITLFDFLLDNRRHGPISEQLLGNLDSITCLFDGEPGDCHSVVPRSTDVIHIRTAPVPPGPSVAASRTATTPTRPPTPPLPSGVWPPGVLRGERISHASHAPAVPVVSIHDETPDSSDFVVFDVYHHARILECRITDTDERLVMLALEATPEIGSVFHWRRVQFLLPGFPKRQMLWGDRLPNSVILPIAFGPGPTAVCTVEAVQSFSALQIVILACRACQLPHFLIQGVADSESALWINEQRQYPLDPHAGVSADTARLLGFGISSFLESRHSQSSQLSSVSSGAREAREFLRSIDDSMLGASSHFAVLAEPAHVILLPLPEGASLAELVYRAFGQFPGFDARCGHRILCRPLPGLPPIQVCVWDNLAADQRVLQVVFSDDSAEVFSVRCPAIATPVQLASAASHTGLNSLTPSLADRTQHLTGDGIPLQPAQVYMFRHFEVLRVRAGPPPTRLPGISRFCRSPLPDSLECVTSEDVSDGDHLEQIVVHQVGALPVVLHAAALFRPAQVSHEATQSLGLPANWRLRYPLTAPLVAGTVPHAVLAGAADLPGGSYAICDFRRILRPPIVPFITIQVPAIVTNQVLQDLLSQVLPHLAPYRAIYIDQDRLEEGASVGCAACTVTFLGWSPQTFSWHSNLAPAVLDTLHATAQREGFLHAFARAPRRAVTQHTTSTTTTAFSLLLDGNSTFSTTTRPSAGTGSLGSTESSTSQEEGYSQPGSSSAVPRAATLPTDLATNPDLLDFVHDPLAIHRLDAAEIPLAYSLFDSVLQTRLAYRDASWSVADCLSEAVRHFAHLGPGTVLHVLNDEVAGLPSPQIVATAGIQHHRLRALPIDARPVGHGICVVEVPKIASPYTAVYWARSICPFQGLPPRLAKGFISARAHGRHLSPLVDMPQQVDSLSLWSDSVPSRPGGGVLPLNARMRDLVRDIRDLAADAFANSGEVPAMLHLPGGPPIQFWVNRHDSLAIMADEASSAVWPFTFHSNLRLHLPGTFPLGTDALLHFLVEIEGRCPAGSTIYLFDGRSLGPTGPPFRSMVLPRRIALVALLDAANSLFPEARAANSIRANGRLVTRWEVREYSFPLIRPTASNAPFIEVPPLDESCLPAFAVASLFPGIAIALQTTLGEMHSCGLPPALDLEEAQLPPRRVIEPSPVPGASVDPLPFLLEVPPPNSLVSQAEIVVLSLHFPAFRLWIPTTFTLNQLRNAVAQGVGQQVVALRWPRVVPCLAGSPAVVIASFAQDNHRATLGIVDARRVHPLQGPSIWLITLPQSVQTSELNALALTDRQVVQTPQHTRVDGRHCTGLLRFRQGIFILTISATCDDARDCIDWQHPSDLPVGLQMGFYTEAPLVSSTTTTTCLADPFFPFAPSTTSTTSALPDDAEPRVTFYITSGLFPPLVLHAGDSLDCAELLASAAFRFYEKKVSPPMTTWLLSKRAYQLHNKRWAFFICSGYATHEPREAAVWVDAGPAWPHPYMIHVPCFATWTQVKARIFLQLDSSAHVTVNGILWEGTSHFFANGFVIQIRTRQQHLISRSVLSFADRFDGLLALQCPCDGPVTIDWHTLDPSEQRSRFLQHFRDHLERYRPITECLPPFSSVLLYVQGTGAFLFSAGTRLPAGANDVQNYFDRCLAGVVGDGFVQDLKFVWGDCSLFVVRLPSCSDTLWVHLDGDLLDFWELGESYDLSQIPTFDGHILYPMEELRHWAMLFGSPFAMQRTQSRSPGPPGYLRDRPPPLRKGPSDSRRRSSIHWRPRHCMPSLGRRQSIASPVWTAQNLLP